jgi:hypothetical protein
MEFSLCFVERIAKPSARRHGMGGYVRPVCAAHRAAAARRARFSLVGVLADVRMGAAADCTAARKSNLPGNYMKYIERIDLQIIGDLAWQ